jgi:hypothetical protein
MWIVSFWVVTAMSVVRRWLPMFPYSTHFYSDYVDDTFIRNVVSPYKTPRRHNPGYSPHKKKKPFTHISEVALGSLVVACLPLDPIIAGLNLVKDDGIFVGDKNL